MFLKATKQYNSKIYAGINSTATYMALWNRRTGQFLSKICNSASLKRITVFGVGTSMLVQICI